MDPFERQRLQLSWKIRQEISLRKQLLRQKEDKLIKARQAAGRKCLSEEVLSEVKGGAFMVRPARFAVLDWQPPASEMVKACWAWVACGCEV